MTNEEKAIICVILVNGIDRDELRPEGKE